MSLLLEALKKAEKSKQKRAENAGLNEALPVEPSMSVVELDFPEIHAPEDAPAPLPAATTAPVSEAELPPLSLDLALEPAPLPSVAEPAPEPEQAPAPAVDLPPPAPVEPPPPPPIAEPERIEPQMAPSAPPAPKPVAAPMIETHTARAPWPDTQQNLKQESAKTVFMAKPPRQGSPRPMLLGSIAIGITLASLAGYYAWQIFLAPTASPMRPVAPPTTPTQPQSQTPPTAPEPLPENPPPALEPTPAVPPSPAISVAREAAPPPTDDSAIQIRRSTPTVKTDPALVAGYQAFQAGDLAQAEKQYRKAIKHSPNSRDALLGLAAIAARRHAVEEASGHYLKLIELDPKDSAAQAGLLSLKGMADPVQSESRLKNLLAQQQGGAENDARGEAGFTHFTLGNLYARQQRWSEAQQAYFNAISADPSNADYAFNLAVSLDHLEQPRLALEYYQRALVLSESHPAVFDRMAAKNRIAELQKP